MPRSFTLTARIQSMTHAARGIALVLRSQHNAWVHLAATVAVTALGLALGLERREWCWIVIATVTVWTAEAVNTALELLCDIISPGFHPRIRDAKDVATGAVLLSAAGAVVIGLLILGPHLLDFLREL